MCDGASSVILATEDACVKYNLKPLARILAYSFSGEGLCLTFSGFLNTYLVIVLINIKAVTRK